MGNLLERHAGKPFYATEKLDGFSMSFGVVDGDFILSARERMVDEWEDSVFADASRELRLRERVDGAGVLFQGELVGPGIRGNRYRLDGLRLHVFNAIRDGQFVSFAELETLCRNIGLPVAPILATGFLATRENALEFACGQSTINPLVEREGAVFRPVIETVDEFQGRVSAKVFNPKFG